MWPSRHRRTSSVPPLLFPPNSFTVNSDPSPASRHHADPPPASRSSQHQHRLQAHMVMQELRRVSPASEGQGDARAPPRRSRGRLLPHRQGAGRGLKREGGECRRSDGAESSEGSEGESLEGRNGKQAWRSALKVIGIAFDCRMVAASVSAHGRGR